MQINLNYKYEPLFKNDPNIFFVFLYSGRAAGKSFAISTYLATRLLNDKGNLVFCRQYMSNVATSIIPEFLDKIEIMGIRKFLKVNKDSITCTFNGNTLWFKGLETAEGTAEASMKGIPRLACVVIDEMQEVKEPAFDRLIGTIRDKSLNLKIICALNPTSTSSWQYERFFKELPNYNFTGQIDNRYYIYSSYLENINHVSDTYLHMINNIKKTDPVKFDNQYLGKWLENNEKSALTKELIQLAQKKIQLPDYYQKTIIAIDPAVSANQNSDDTGIIVVGFKDNQYFILADSTGIYQPSEWAIKVKELYQKYNCDEIIYESNQGGLLVEQNIRNVIGDFCSIESVRATKGKLLRWEPCRALYELNKVHHLKHFEDLNYELLTYGTSLNKRSPGHLDALCWGLTWLAQNQNKDGSAYI